MRTFKVEIRGITPYSQSRYIHAEKQPGETDNDLDRRVWREHMHVEDGHVVIPATGLMDAIQSGAAIDDEKVVGRGNRKWGTLFKGGIAIYENVKLNVKETDVKPETYMCDARGQKGDRSSTRVPRTFPVIAKGWHGAFEIDVLDDSIPEDRLRGAIETAGLRIGIGRFRPSKGGTNGRFVIESMEKID